MKKFLLYTCLFFILFSCASNKKVQKLNFFETKSIKKNGTSTNIYGNIFDKFDKYPLAESEITIRSKDRNYSSISDKKGNFKFLNIEPREYTIEVYYVGYYSFKDKLVIQPNEVLNVRIGLGYDE